MTLVVFGWHKRSVLSPVSANWGNDEANQKSACGIEVAVLMAGYMVIPNIYRRMPQRAVLHRHKRMGQPYLQAARNLWDCHARGEGDIQDNNVRHKYCSRSGGIMLNAIRAWNVIKIIVVVYGVFLFVKATTRWRKR